jgi:chloride channel 7
MSQKVVFVRPVEKVGVVYDILRSCNHTNFPVVDTDDGDILYGTIGRNALCILLKQRAYGLPKKEDSPSHSDSIVYNFHTLEDGNERFLPLVQWDRIEKAYPKYPSIADIRISKEDRDCFVDLRPYVNTAPICVRESASISRSYQIFRSIGLRFLPVVNRHNQVVGIITRPDLTPEALADKMLHRGEAKKLQ